MMRWNNTLHYAQDLRHCSHSSVNTISCPCGIVPYRGAWLWSETLSHSWVQMSEVCVGWVRRMPREPGRNMQNMRGTWHWQTEADLCTQRLKELMNIVPLLGCQVWKQTLAASPNPGIPSGALPQLLIFTVPVDLLKSTASIGRSVCPLHLGLFFPCCRSRLVRNDAPSHNAAFSISISGGCSWGRVANISDRYLTMKLFQISRDSPGLTSGSEATLVSRGQASQILTTPTSVISDKSVFWYVMDRRWFTRRPWEAGRRHASKAQNPEKKKSINCIKFHTKVAILNVCQDLNDKRIITQASVVL